MNFKPLQGALAFTSIIILPYSFIHANHVIFPQGEFEKLFTKQTSTSQQQQPTSSTLANADPLVHATSHHYTISSFLPFDAHCGVGTHHSLTLQNGYNYPITITQCEKLQDGSVRIVGNIDTIQGTTITLLSNDTNFSFTGYISKTNEGKIYQINQHKDGSASISPL